MSLSDPRVSRLLNEAFVPVVFSMHLQGPGVDDPARAFINAQRPQGQSDIHPPDTYVVDPDGQVLGHIRYDAGVPETLAFLRDILKAHPQLAPPDPLLVSPAPPADDAEATLLALEARYDSDDKAGLVADLEAWLAQHADRLPGAAALARTLLAGALYYAGDLAGAQHHWQRIVDEHPDHPVRHRAAYNLIEPNAWPSPVHPELRDARHPDVAERGLIVPSPDLRAANLARVASDDRYVQVRPHLPFARIPAGTFTMGGSPALQARELPNRRVTLSRPFLLSAWPVTRRLWRHFRPDAFPGALSEGLAGDLPALQISCDEADAFVAFLSARDGRRYRLPTEAEWEYAARGGLEGKAHPWGDEPPDPTRCNYLNPRAVPVACYPPNGYGLFDNVSQ